MKWIKITVVAATFLVVQQAKAAYEFIYDINEFKKLMIDYYEAGATVGTSTITFLPSFQVSGAGGIFNSQITVKVFGDDTLYSSDPEKTTGYVAFITAEPYSKFIESITFTGSLPVDFLDTFQYGMDSVAPVPEPSTYLAGIGALGILALSFRRKAV